MTKLKVAIIGIGHLGSKHLKVYNDLRGRVEIVGICDINKERTLKLAEHYRVPFFADYRELADDILRLAVRGAPAIGVAGAFGVVLGMQAETGLDSGNFRKRLEEVCNDLAATRPTAVNLFWAIDRMKKLADSLG